MRRAFIVFMLLLVQFQLVWGAAAVYCAHEASPAAARHFGHHDHRHQGAEQQQSPGADEGKTVLPSFHVDCASCQAGTLSALSVSFSPVDTRPRADFLANCSDRYRSHCPSALERPDRSSHVAAS